MQGVATHGARVRWRTRVSLARDFERYVAKVENEAFAPKKSSSSNIGCEARPHRTLRVQTDLDPRVEGRGVHPGTTILTRKSSRKLLHTCEWA